MQKMDHGSIAILRSAPEVPRRKYRQESNFYYLTGFDEPDSVCLIIPDHPEHKFVLFVRPKDRGAERLSGIRVGVEDAVEQYGADIAHAIDEFDERILAYLDKAEKICNYSGCISVVKGMNGWPRSAFSMARTTLRPCLRTVEM